MLQVTGYWLFDYDGDGKRVCHLVTEGTASSLTQYFMSGGYEVTSDTVAGTSTVKKYYALVGSTACPLFFRGTPCPITASCNICSPITLAAW
jgi:hypothetical protein